MPVLTSHIKTPKPQIKLNRGPHQQTSKLNQTIPSNPKYRNGNYWFNNAAHGNGNGYESYQAASCDAAVNVITITSSTKQVILTTWTTKT